MIEVMCLIFLRVRGEDFFVKSWILLGWRADFWLALM